MRVQCVLGIRPQTGADRYLWRFVLSSEFPCPYSLGMGTVQTKLDHDPRRGAFRPEPSSTFTPELTRVCWRKVPPRDRSNTRTRLRWIAAEELPEHVEARQQE